MQNNGSLRKLLLLLILIASPAVAQPVSDTELNSQMEVCRTKSQFKVVTEQGPVDPLTKIPTIKRTPQPWKPGFESCELIKEEWTRRGEAVLSGNDPVEKDSVDATAQKLKK